MTAQRQSVSGPTVWSGAEYTANREWIYHFSAGAIADIDQAIARVRSKQRRLDDITAEDFDLPALADDLEQMSEILGSGRGFVLLKGLPIEKYSDEEFEIILWGIGTHLGVGVSQSHLGDRIGQVKDINGVGRYYTAGGPIEVHMDPVDVVALLCLRKAKKGGESWIISPALVRNILLEENPEHLALLYEGFRYGSTGGESGGFQTDHRLPVLVDQADGPVCFYLPKAILGWSGRDRQYLSEQQLAALDHFNEIAQRPEVGLKMDLQPGDIQFLNNRRVLHARTDYEDHAAPALARHMLRLWLMMPEWPALPESMHFLEQTDRAGGGIPKGGSQIAAD